MIYICIKCHRPPLLFLKQLTAKRDSYWWKWEISTCRTMGLLALECQRRLTKAGRGLGGRSTGSYVLLGKWLFFSLWKSFAWFFVIRGLHRSKNTLFNGATEISESFPKMLHPKMTPHLTDKEDSFCTAKSKNANIYPSIRDRNDICHGLIWLASTWIYFTTSGTFSL